MNLTDRLSYLRKRVQQPLPLSLEAASLLETLKAEDPDLGEAKAFGETLAPERVSRVVKHETHDEENELTDLISPAMRKALE